MYLTKAKKYTSVCHSRNVRHKDSVRSKDHRTVAYNDVRVMRATRTSYVVRARQIAVQGLCTVYITREVHQVCYDGVGSQLCALTDRHH